MRITLERCLFVAMLCLCMVAGCGWEHDSPADENPPRRTMSFEAGAKVNVVKTEGDQALVRTADGREAFVAKTMLQRRSDLDRSDEPYTHVFAAAAPGFEEGVEKKPPAPRSMHEIVNERLKLNRLYLTEKTHKEIIAPVRVVDPIDPETGERCFAARVCLNPDCPGKALAKGDRPYLFIRAARGVTLECPACAEAHDPATRSPDEVRRYRRWIKLYELPESAARLKQLQAEQRTARSQPLLEE